MSSNLEARVQRLIDIEDIKQLKARYAAYCDDDYNADGLAALFRRGCGVGRICSWIRRRARGNSHVLS